MVHGSQRLKAITQSLLDYKMLLYRVNQKQSSVKPLATNIKTKEEFINQELVCYIKYVY